MLPEENFIHIVREKGGRVFIVGGWVRDKILGRQPKDKDYVLTGITEGIFQKNFPQASKIGKSFPVYELDISGVRCEIAFARKERKKGIGYKGFVSYFSPAVTIEEDLYRRDTTMNSMALELPMRRLIDPFGGRQDICRKQIRAVSAAFCEDPVRSLRAARQAAELDFSIADDTLRLMADTVQELGQEPPERIFNEMRRALSSDRASVFFYYLERIGLLSVTFPELFAMRGKKLPTPYISERDAFQHSLMVLDKAAAVTHSLEARFAALVHHIGQGRTTEAGGMDSYGSEKIGKEAIMSWNRRCPLPRKWLEAAIFVIREHRRVAVLQKEEKIVALILSIEKSRLSIEGFRAIILADYGFLPKYLVFYEDICQALSSISGRDCPSGLRGRDVGEWLLQARTRVYREFCAKHGF